MSRQNDLFTESLYHQISAMENLQEKDLLWITDRIYMHYVQEPYTGEVKWSNRLKTSGANIRYDPKTGHGLIQVNRQYAEKFGKLELLEILKHELAHYYLYKQGKLKHGHGEVFKKTLRKIFHSECIWAKRNEDVYRYTYVCRKCKSVYKSTKNIKRAVYCGRCTKENHGQIKEAFRMDQEKRGPFLAFS